MLIIVGGGGHARVVLDSARSSGHGEVLVCDPRVAGTTLDGAPVARTDELALAAEFGARARFVVAIGDPGIREALTRKLAAAGVRWATIVHGSAIVSPSAALGAGSVVLPRAVVNAGASIGAAAIVNTGAVIEHDVAVGEGTHIAPGVVITGGVTIGAWSFVGANATVLPGVRIGDRAVVGAGSVVTKPVSNGATVVGAPARTRPSP